MDFDEYFRGVGGKEFGVGDGGVESGAGDEKVGCEERNDDEVGAAERDVGSKDRGSKDVGEKEELGLYRDEWDCDFCGPECFCWTVDKRAKRSS